MIDLRMLFKIKNITKEQWEEFDFKFRNDIEIYDKSLESAANPIEWANKLTNILIEYADELPNTFNGVYYSMSNEWISKIQFNDGNVVILFVKHKDYYLFLTNRINTIDIFVFCEGERQKLVKNLTI